ncbi:hypothetical protein CHU95_17625 [Niveispirillum lacus]|uniref:SnoaL-like domain-containing protein n=1 Tax=Niveispirillum lacus TaxID=1981099 RepID=A0A255YTT5_9PROT|nr:hypothetical protein CHU95_17625 [Niveispirillum lacus]
MRKSRYMLQLFQESLSLWEKYFLAWTTHNTEGIQEIFTQDCRYIIIKRRIICFNLSRLLGYWIRNKYRQRNLKISWKKLFDLRDMSFAYFKSEFFDVEADRDCVVRGVICIKGRDKIKLLAEVYIVREI